MAYEADALLVVELDRLTRSEHDLGGTGSADDGGTMKGRAVDLAAVRLARTNLA
jgi:hypothetical protein